MLKKSLEVEILGHDGKPNERFPDGSAGGDCYGYNNNVIVCVVYNMYNSKDPYETFMFNLMNHNMYYYKCFTNGKDAIKLAENILHGGYNFDMDVVRYNWLGYGINYDWED